MFDIEKKLLEYGLTTDSYEQLLKDCSDKVHKINDMDWADIVEKYNLGIHYDSLRKSTQIPITGSVFVSEYYKWKESRREVSNKEDKYLNELKQLKRDIEKEKIKLRTEKLEYAKWTREEARDEMVLDRISEAISDLTPLTIPEYIPLTHNKKEYLLVEGDEHYGVEFELKDLLGETLNAYNPKIFESRMWDLQRQVIEIIKKEDINVLNIFSMGDFMDGILRVSQLMKLAYGVVEGTIKYANFMSEWLNEFTKYVYVKFQIVDGNHSELRMLGQPKGTFTDDNMGKIVYEFIKERLKDNPNFHICKNPTGMIYSELCGYKILGIHGEVKNMEQAIKDFSKVYGVAVDYLIGGHLHHSKAEDVGFASSVINIPSIIGVDPYSLSLNKTSDPGATLLVFEEFKGKVCEYSLKLN